jgi:5-formyltetrahydrofolate cyclo-ligase
MGSDHATATAKQALRARMRAARAAVAPDEGAAAAARVEATLMELPAIRRASTVLAFASFGSEIPTAGILSRLRSAGKRVLLPFLTDGEVEAAFVAADAPMVASSYGPVEPADRGAADPSAIDVVILPGLAFDRFGRRLGYGGGYLDRYLRRVRASSPRIAIGFALQVVDEVPASANDERVDLVVTEAGVVECPPRPAG